MSTFSEVTYWLTLINQSGLKLNLIKPIIQRWCIAENRSLAGLFNLSLLDLTATFGLSDDEAQKITAATGKLNEQATVLAQWQAKGYEPIICTNSRFPQRLLYSLPPAKHPLILWVHGPVELLNRPGVTMLGRQDPDQATSDFIDELISTLETEAIGLVSGYGRGLDRVSFETILSTKNGYGVAVLPMGLNTFTKTTAKLENAVKAKRAILVSPFAPDTPFHEKLGEARNLLIDHMTLALLIPESDEETQDRAADALNRGLPVFVKANTADNRTLIDQGALLLTDPGEVVEWVQQALVDVAIQEAESEAPVADLAAPLTSTAPSDPPLSNDNYSLRTEEIPPLDSDEAMEVLSLGGDIPEILRKRLQQPKDTDEK